MSEYCLSFGEYYLTKDSLYHHGVKGQKWGVRNYQNPDGSLTPAGRLHYGYGNVLGKVEQKTGSFSGRARDAAATRKYGRIGSSIANRAATAANVASRTAASLKQISESNDSGFKKALRSASYMAVPKVSKIVNPYSGDSKTSISILSGSGYKANKQKALADQYATSEKYRSTKYGRYSATVAKKNAESFAKYFEDRANSNSVKEYVKNTLKVFNVPVTRISGKQSTVGRELITAVALTPLYAVTRGGEHVSAITGTSRAMRNYNDQYSRRNRRKAEARKRE